MWNLQPDHANSVTLSDMDAPFNTLDVLPLILNQKYHLDRYNYNINAHSYHLCCLVIQVPFKRNYQYILR